MFKSSARSLIFTPRFTRPTVPGAVPEGPGAPEPQISREPRETGSNRALERSRTGRRRRKKSGEPKPPALFRLPSIGVFYFPLFD